MKLVFRTISATVSWSDNKLSCGGSLKPFLAHFHVTKTTVYVVTVHVEIVALERITIHACVNGPQADLITEFLGLIREIDDHFVGSDVR